MSRKMKKEMETSLSPVPINLIYTPLSFLLFHLIIPINDEKSKIIDHPKSSDCCYKYCIEQRKKKKSFTDTITLIQIHRGIRERERENRMHPFDYPHSCYNPRNCNIMPDRKEDDQHSPPHLNYPPYPSTYHPPSYYHYGPPHLPYVQPPPSPVPPCYYPQYCPPYPTYFIPPPPPCNYPVDHHHPCYDDYYKHQNNRTHCCGCSNHTCQPRNVATPSLRIQEEPFNQSERKESDNVVPPSNYASPIIWRLPSSDSVKANSNSNDKYVGKAWEKDEGGKKNSQSPSYPVIWLPGNSGFEEMGRDKNPAASKPAQEWPSKFKFVPLKFLENGTRAEPETEVHRVAPAADKMSNLRTMPHMKVDREGNVGKAVEGEEMNQSSNFKNVPLKCADNGEDRILEKDIQQEAHDPVEKKGIKVRTIPVKHEKSSEKSCKMSSDKDKKEGKIEGKEESKSNSTSEKKKLSTTKSSKLPPVCLRVDPRPRKTSANSSGTLKPTTAAAATSASGTKNNKESNGGNEEPTREKMIPVNIVNACNQNEPVMPVNTAKDNKPSQDKKEQVSEERVTVASPEKNASMDHSSSEASEVISEESNVENLEKSIKENHAKTSEQKANVDEEKVEEPTEKIDEKSSSKKVLSDTDAATIIQAAYRGFEVRRWHLLEKLKKIAKVRKETENIRRQVDDIEACPPHQLDAKKKVVLGETIMHLLLELDTIQGLHPSVKDVRKSLAKELTSIEDKLDSIYSRKAKEVEGSKCESNIVCSAPDTLKLDSSEPDSMGDKGTTLDAEQPTKSDDGAVDVTSSTLVCEAAAHEHNVQVDDNGTKNNETTQKEKSSSKDTVEEEEASEVVKHPCSERDMDSTVSTTSLSKEPFKPASEEDANPSNVLVHQPEDEHDSSKQNSVALKDGYIVENLADYAELKSASYELPNVNIASDDAPVKKNDSTSDNPDSIDDKMSISDAELQGRSDVSLNCSSSGDDGAVDVTSSTQHDVHVDDNAIKNLETVEEEKLQYVNERVEEEEISEEVKDPCFERGVDSNVPTASVEGMNPSNILEHQVVDEHFALKEDKVSDLEEEKDNSAEPNVASDKLPSINDASNRAVESMDGEEERSWAVKADGESIVIGNESENASEAAMVGEDKQVVSEGFDAPRNVEDDYTKNVEMDSKTEVFVSNEGSNATAGKEGDELKKEEVQLMEENENLRKMIEKLVQSGNKQMDVINSLNGRVKDLEKKLQQTKKKRMKVRRNRAVKNHRSNEVGGN